MPDGATRAADRLAAECPGLRIAGTLCPDFGFEKDPLGRTRTCCAKVADAATRPGLRRPGLPQAGGRDRPDLRPELPRAWFVGCGAAVNFVAGDVDRAPRWMQRTGLEWAHRLGTEPRRLAGRYLRHDAPYALRLLAQAPAAGAPEHHPAPRTAARGHLLEPYDRTVRWWAWDFCSSGCTTCRSCARPAATLEAAGCPVEWDPHFPGHRRLYATDAHGNRLEFLEAVKG